MTEAPRDPLLDLPLPGEEEDDEEASERAASEPRRPAVHALPPRRRRGRLIVLAALRPDSRLAMHEIHGVGEKKLERYADIFLGLIREHSGGGSPPPETGEPSGSVPSPAGDRSGSGSPPPQAEARDS